jgi:hypothetical protein
MPLSAASTRALVKIVSHIEQALSVRHALRELFTVRDRVDPAFVRRPA